MTNTLYISRTFLALLGRMVWLANAKAPMAYYKHEFYTLKNRLLNQYGIQDGFDLQEIIRECWGCEACRESSSRWSSCDGDGIYSQRYVVLARWVMWGYRFHSIDRVFNYLPDGMAKPTITGYIQHPFVPYRKAVWAWMVLLLIFDRRQLLGNLKILLYYRLIYPFIDTFRRHKHRYNRWKNSFKAPNEFVCEDDDLPPF